MELTLKQIRFFSIVLVFFFSQNNQTIGQGTINLIGNNFENGLNQCATIPADCITGSLQNMINTYQNDYTGNNASLSQYWFQGEIVYAFDHGNFVADGGLDIYNKRCEYQCNLYGFAGLQDCNGVNFSSNAYFLALLWSQQTAGSSIDFCNGEWTSGGHDAFLSLDRGVDNSRSFLIRDNSGISSSVSSSSFQVPANRAMSISFSYLPESMETTEDFIVKVEDVTTGQAVFEKRYVSGTDFQNNQRYFESLIVESANTSSVYKLIFQCDASSNLDKVFIDNVLMSFVNSCEVGQSCDDENDCTLDDIINLNCECEGFYPPGAGQSCACVGAFIDEDQDGICNVEDPDDMNPCIPNPDSENCEMNTVCTIYPTIDFEENLLNCIGDNCWKDGGHDVFRWPTRGVNNSASYLLRDNSGVASSITSPNLYFNHGTQVRVEFSLLAESMEFGEDFIIELFATPEDLGIEGQTILYSSKSYKSGTDFNNGVRTQIDAYLNYPFGQLYFYNVRIRCDASSNSDKIYIDNLIVSDCGSESNCQVGSPCDDLNACTVNDVFAASCTCQGTLPSEADLSCNCVSVFIDNDQDGICIQEDPDDSNSCIPISDHPSCDTNCDAYHSIDFQQYDYNCSGPLCWGRRGVTAIYGSSGFNNSATILLFDNNALNSNGSFIVSPSIIPTKNSIQVSFDYRSNGVTNQKQPLYVELLQFTDGMNSLEEANLHSSVPLLFQTDFVDEVWAKASIDFLFPTFIDATYRIRIRNSSTYGNDIYRIDNINVQGCHVDLPCLAFSSCDDNDPCTINDNYGTDCNCAGIFIDDDNDGICNFFDQCSGISDALIGTPCDDGDSCTIDDRYDAICACMGVLPPEVDESCNCTPVFIDNDNDGICSLEDHDDSNPCIPDNTRPGCQSTGVCTLYFSQDFNSGFENWIDNGADVFLWPVRGVNNSPSVVIRDNSGLQSSLTSPPIFEHREMALSINFSFVGDGMEEDEDFFVELFYTAEDLGFVEEPELIHSQAYVFNALNFQNGVRYFKNETVILSYDNPILNQAGYGGPGFLSIVFRADASSNYDKVYLDDISFERCELGPGQGNENAEMDPECFFFAPCRNDDPTKIYAYNQSCECTLVYDSGPIHGCHTYDPQDDTFTDFEDGVIGIWSVNAPDVLVRQDPIMGACLRMQGQSETLGDLDIHYTDEGAISFDIIGTNAQELDALAIEFMSNGEVLYKIETLKFNRDFTNSSVSQFATWFSNESGSADYDIRLRSNMLSNGTICIDNIQTYGCAWISKETAGNSYRGISDVEQVDVSKSSLFLYPNPASDYLHIMAELVEGIAVNDAISIYNINGQLMKKIIVVDTKSFKVDISTLPKNQMYFVHAQTKNGPLIEKVFVQ